MSVSSRYRIALLTVVLVAIACKRPAEQPTAAPAQPAVLATNAAPTATENPADTKGDFDLRAPAIAEFIKQANDPSTALGKLIVQHNKHIEAGAIEPSGRIDMPLTAKSLQSMEISGEYVWGNPWHGRSLSEDRKTCQTTGDHLTLLIAIGLERRANIANELDSRLFTISAFRSSTFPAGPDGELCQETPPEFVKITTEITFSEIEEVGLK